MHGKLIAVVQDRRQRSTSLAFFAVWGALGDKRSLDYRLALAEGAAGVYFDVDLQPDSCFAR